MKSEYKKSETRVVVVVVDDYDCLYYAGNGRVTLSTQRNHASVLEQIDMTTMLLFNISLHILPLINGVLIISNDRCADVLGHTVIQTVGV